MATTSVWGRVWTVARLIAALGIGAAIVAQLIQSITGAVENGRHVVTIVTNFFSFFTILSNLLAVIVLLWAVFWFWSRGSRRRVEPAALAFCLAAVTTYMIVTGIVYNLLLRDYVLEPGAVVPWSNEVLHLVGPAFLLLDLFLGPKRRRLPWTALVGILVFPLVWVVYTLVRAGFITNPATGDPWWYPYPFLNPHLNDGPALFAYIGGIAVGITLVATVVVWVGRLRGRTADAAPAVATADPAVAAIAWPAPAAITEPAALAAGPVVLAPVAVATVASPAEVVVADAAVVDESAVEIVETEAIEPEVETLEADLIDEHTAEAARLEETPSAVDPHSDH